MNIGAIKDIMETYTELTKITTICMDTSERKIPLYIKGLDFAFLLGNTEYGEVIDFLQSKDKYLCHIEENVFHTLYTKNNFIYNIIFMKMDENTKIELVAGPMVKILSEMDPMEEVVSDYNTLKHPYIFLRKHALPVISENSIYWLGKLFVVLLKMQVNDTPVQKVHGRENSKSGSYSIKVNDPMDEVTYSYEYKKIYQLFRNLVHKIRDGDTNGINRAVMHNIALIGKDNFRNDNLRSMKDKCIIICTAACYTAMESNAAFDRMFDILVRAVHNIEKMHNITDVLQIMLKTVERYTRTVKGVSEKHYSIHIRHTLQYIHNHYSEKITLEKLADYIHINPVYLSSLIKKETKMSLSNHINMIRIEKSKSLLTGSSKSIQEIAFMVGYNYQNHYNMVFKKQEGITPSEYRRNFGKMN